MTKSEDIVNLFQQFGGQVDDYQELSRQQSAEQAKKRWPLLSALELGQATAVTAPGVAAAEAPVTAGPIEFRPAPVAPPVQVLAPTGQHLSAAELALGTPAPAPAPVSVSAQPSAPEQAPALAGISAAAMAPATPSSTPAHTPVHWPAPTVAAASPTAWTPAVPAAPVRTPEAPLLPVTAPVFSSPPASPSVPAPQTTPNALASTSPLASLAQAAHVASAPVAAPAPSTELQGIFARLAGRAEVAPPPPPSGLAALWQNLRGGA